MNNNELEVWKDRIATRKASGLTVSEWCQKNHFTKYKYYYWYKLINGPKLESKILPSFVEVLSNAAVSPSYGIKISCKDVEISLSNKNDVTLAVELIHELQKTC